MNRKVIIIGAGIAGPAMAIQLQRLGIIAEIFEARRETAMQEGLFMGLTPNGLNVLSEYIDIEELYDEYTTGTIGFYNAKGRKIGNLSTSNQISTYGMATIQIKRARISALLRKEAENKGINIRYHAKLTAITTTESGITVSLQDGTSHQADFVIACDGVHSICRKIIFPDAPAPKYTMQLSTGGIIEANDMEIDENEIKMIFGQKAFFAFAKSNKNRIWWFNNFYREKEPTKEAIQTSLQTEIKAYLLRTHQCDPKPVTEIIQQTDDIFAYPVYEMPVLDQWYTDRVCLIGDAAHATSPHIGQGASLALEDTIILGRCLAKYDKNEVAFRRFQQLRKNRVHKIVHQARKVGKQKANPGAVATFFRDLLLRHFIKLETKKMHWVYAYRATQVSV